MPLENYFEVFRIRKYSVLGSGSADPLSWLFDPYPGGQSITDPDLDAEPTWSYLWPLKKICCQQGNYGISLNFIKSFFLKFVCSKDLNISYGFIITGSESGGQLNTDPSDSDGQLDTDPQDPEHWRLWTRDCLACPWVWCVKRARWPSFLPPSSPP